MYMAWRTPQYSLALTVGVVVGFNVRYTKAVEALARLRGVTLLTHNVIYKLLELLKVCVYEGWVALAVVILHISPSSAE